MQRKYFNPILFSSVLIVVVSMFYGCVKHPLDQNPTGQYTTSKFLA